MAVRTKATVKTLFETGDRPTQTDFETFIDSVIFQNDGATGVVNVLSTASATTHAIGSFGEVILAASSTASAQGHLGVPGDAGTLGQDLYVVDSTASARGHLGLSTTDSPTFAGATLESTDAGAGVGPALYLHRNSASPAANDFLGDIRFSGESSAGTQRNYGRIITQIVTAADGSEDGKLLLRTIRGGTDTSRLIVENGIYTPSATGGDQGADTINASGLYVNGVAVGGGWVHLYSNTISAGVTEVDISDGDLDWTAYDMYKVKYTRGTVDTDDVELYFRVYDTTLAAWQSDASDYKYTSMITYQNSVVSQGNAGTADSEMGIMTGVSLGVGVGNAAGEHFGGEVIIYDPSDTNETKFIKWDMEWVNADTYATQARGVGHYIGTTNAISGLRIFPQSGNIDGLQIEVWGIKNS